MRIIAGEHKSRKLLTPKDDAVTRPIPDRVKESLFGLLRGHCEGAAVFDAFAGTGALGLEAISRGAARCVFVEKDRGAAEMLKANIETLGVGDRSEVVIGDALGPGALSRCPRPATIVFLDPPYPVVLDVLGWRRVKDQLSRLVDLLSDDGFAILRTPSPFFHVLAEPAADPPAGPGALREGRKPKRRRDRERDQDWRLGRDRGAGGREDRPPEIEDEEDQEPQPEEAAPVPPAAPVQHVDVDLTLPNAVGPETHVYHSTAVHLYMRKR
jgi:16S rRNA (guanine966-N2)-methyltransferase